MPKGNSKAAQMHDLLVKAGASGVTSEAAAKALGAGKHVWTAVWVLRKRRHLNIILKDGTYYLQPASPDRSGDQGREHKTGTMEDRVLAALRNGPTPATDLEKIAGSRDKAYQLVSRLRRRKGCDITNISGVYSLAEDRRNDAHVPATVFDTTASKQAREQGSAIDRALNMLSSKDREFVVHLITILIERNLSTSVISAAESVASQIRKELR